MYLLQIMDYIFCVQLLALKNLDDKKFNFQITCFIVIRIYIQLAHRTFDTTTPTIFNTYKYINSVGYFLIASISNCEFFLRSQLTDSQT